MNKRTRVPAVWVALIWVVSLITACGNQQDPRQDYLDTLSAEFDALVARIREFPHSGALLAGYPPEFEVRVFHFKSFRHSLIVATVDGATMVYAVAHQRRRPGYWKDRI